MDIFTVKSTLENFVNARELCCLCLRDTADDSLCTNDMVYVPVNNDGTWVVFNEILEEILNEDVSEISFTRSVVCKDCSSIAINTYKLIDKWHRNKQFLGKLVNNFNLCLLSDPPKLSSAMYISVNKEIECTTSYVKRKRIKTQKELSMLLQKSKKIYESRSKNHDIIIKIDPSFQDEFSEDKFVMKLLCDVCSQECPSKKAMKMHFLKKHTPKIYTCDKCPKSFATDHMLQQHTKTNHLTVICSICGKTYTSIHSLNAHQYTHQPLTCSLCGRSYKTIRCYKKHVSTKRCTQQKDTNIRTLEKSFKCDLCQKSYVNKVTLQTHMRFEHGDGKYLQCNWCDKRFNAQSRLNMHVVTHTKERNYTCETCDKKFVTKEALLYHTRIHTGETPYSCPQCSQRFLSASRRMDHIRRRHSAPTQRCDLCPRAFAGACALRKHRKRHFDPTSKLFKAPLDESFMTTG